MHVRVCVACADNGGQPVHKLYTGITSTNSSAATIWCVLLLFLSCATFYVSCS